MQQQRRDWAATCSSDRDWAATIQSLLRDRRERPTGQRLLRGIAIGELRREERRRRRRLHREGERNGQIAKENGGGVEKKNSEIMDGLLKKMNLGDLGLIRFNIINI